MPPAYLAPNITTLPSCQVLRRQASRQPHPPPTRRSPSPDAVMLRITSSGLPGPLPSAPRGLPLVPLYSRAVTAPRFAMGLSRPWDSGLFLRSLRLPGDLALLGRSEAGLTSHRLRGVADDRCAATALPLRLVVPFLCPRLRPASLPSDARRQGFSERYCPIASCHLLKSETGGCRHVFLTSSGRHMRDAPPRRSP